MGDIVANIGKGRAVEWYRNVDANVPTGCALVVAGFSGTVTDAVLRDLDTLDAVIGSALAEADQAGYARKVLVAADLAAVTPDDTLDRGAFTLPAQTFTFSGDGTAWTRVGVFYRPAAASPDTAIEFMASVDFPTLGTEDAVTVTFPDPWFTAT